MKFVRKVPRQWYGTINNSKTKIYCGHDEYLKQDGYEYIYHDPNFSFTIVKGSQHGGKARSAVMRMVEHDFLFTMKTGKDSNGEEYMEQYSDLIHCKLWRIIELRHSRLNEGGLLLRLGFMGNLPHSKIKS